MADNHSSIPDGPRPETPNLETERLLLRPVRQDDAPAIQRHFPHWEVVQYLDAVVPWPYPADGAETFLRCVALPAMAEGQIMSWVLTLREPADFGEHLQTSEADEAVGMLSFRPQTTSSQRGFWLARPLHGQGLMTEAIVGFQDYVFFELGVERLVTSNAQSNSGSRRVKQKTGAQLLRLEEASFVNGETLSEVWEVTRQRWAELRMSSDLP